MSRQPNGGFIGKENITDNTQASGIYTLSDAARKVADNEFPPARYTASRSLRFRGSAGAYLSKTNASAGNRQKMTFSFWVKRANVASGFAGAALYGCGAVDGDEWVWSFNDYLYLRWEMTDGSQGNMHSLARYRDASSWYHIMLAIDTTQATASNRLIYYVNGQRITDFNEVQYPAQNTSTKINGTLAENIGRFIRTGDTFDGYMTELNFVDGQQLTPSSFGEYDVRTGEWKPKRYTGTYGTNGYYLSFANNASTTTLGLDDGTGLAGSGAGSNDWTLNNFSVTAGVNYDSMTDVPGVGASVTNDIGGVTRGNYCTLNPLQASSEVTLSSGNLNASGTAGSPTVAATMGFPQSGKYYFEFVPTTMPTSTTHHIGIQNTNLISYTDENRILLRADGNVYNAVGLVRTINGFTTNDVIGLAVDIDNNTLQFYKNGVVNGAPFNNSNSGNSFENYKPYWLGGASGTNTCYFNFGQRAFAYTPPTGFKSLCTTNLPEPTIKRPQDHFDVKLYTGNGTGQTIGNTARRTDNHQVSRSLRFSSTDSSYLTRTPTSVGNRKVYTYSAWIKRSVLGTRQSILSAGTTNSGGQPGGGFYFTSSTDKIEYVMGGGTTTLLTTTQRFTNVNSWMHLVVAWDTTQSQSSERVKIYVDGVRITSFDNTTYPSQNFDSDFNNTIIHAIGSRTDDGSIPNTLANYYLAEVNFVDGQALEPTAFGSFDVDGSWQAKRYTGTYGTNGFYLPFSSSFDSTFGGTFNGTNQFLQTTLPATLSGAFTIEYWFYRSSSGNQFMFTLGDSNTSTGLECYIGTTGTLLQVYSTASQINTTTSVPTNAWSHIAITRDASNVVRLFLNGTRVGGTWTSSAAFSSTLRIGVEFFNSAITGYVNGILSNFRIVNGTALYTGNFSPAISPLTAVSGTALLTLQSNTVVDNSSNSLAITNNNSVTMSAQTPFAGPSVGADGSSSGNNWTLNNFSFAAGASNDSFVDVPTDWGGDDTDSGGEVRGNYATLDPFSSRNISNLTFTNGNLEVTGTFTSINGNLVLSTLSIPPSGKWYVEAANFTLSGGGNAMPVGFTSSTQTIQGSGVTAFGGSLSPRIGVDASVFSNFLKFYSLGAGASLADDTLVSNGYSSGDILSFAIDFDNGRFWVARNGTWYNSGNPAAGTNPTSTFLPGVNPWKFFVEQVSSSDNVNRNNPRVNFGQRAFAYAAPTGFKSINTQNLHEQYPFATGPDLVWIKNRGNASPNHSLMDTVRGALRRINSNSTNAESTNETGFPFFTSNGFNVATNDSAFNASGETYVAWNWNAGNRTVGNQDGTITSTVRASKENGFSIVRYTGTGTAGSTVGHGLGITPKFIMTKRLDSTSNFWVYCQPQQAPYPGQWLYLNLNFVTQNTANASDAPYFKTNPSPSVFTIAGDGINTVNGSYISYVWAEIPGYSRIGSYTGNGNANGAFIYTGFRPAWIMVRRIDAANDWVIEDKSRIGYNVANYHLIANAATVEFTDIPIDFLSNGFKCRGSGGSHNALNGTYVFIAFADSPFKYALAR